MDYHKPSRAALDEVLFCPASVPGIWHLQEEVYELVRIKSEGGLSVEFERPRRQLPEALNLLYTAVEEATERFVAEIRATQARKKE